MVWIVEQPLLIAAIGTLSALILLGGLLKTGRAWLIGAVVGVVVMTIGMLVLERIVVTERERVEGTIHRIASDLESNQAPRVIRHISREAPRLSQEAKKVLSQIVIHEVRVKSNLRVEVGGDPSSEATATFNVVVVASDREGYMQNQPTPRLVTVHLVKEDGSWKVVDYQLDDPI